MRTVATCAASCRSSPACSCWLRRPTPRRSASTTCARTRRAGRRPARTSSPGRRGRRRAQRLRCGDAREPRGRGAADQLDGSGELDGGSGDDVLTGDFREDVLRGGAGDDRLAGLGDADVLEAGSGDDLIDASEQVGARTFDIDEVRCGSGRDRVSEPDIYDRAGGCERIAVGGGLVVDSSTLVKRAGPRVEVIVRCARSNRRCVASVASAAASGVAFNPQMTVRLSPGQRLRLVLRRFNPGGKARLRRSKVIAFGTKDHGFAVRLKS